MFDKFKFFLDYEKNKCGKHLLRFVEHSSLKPRICTWNCSITSRIWDTLVQKYKKCHFGALLGLIFLKTCDKILFMDSFQRQKVRIALSNSWSKIHVEQYNLRKYHFYAEIYFFTLLSPCKMLNISSDDLKNLNLYQERL